MWIAFAFLSAFFAGITSILAKCGIKKTDSNVATAIRTVVVLIFSWIMVFIVGSQDTISQIGLKALVFLILSGLATGASWLCYFHALQKGDINKVVPIDKSSPFLPFSPAAMRRCNLRRAALCRPHFFRSYEKSAKKVRGGLASPLDSRGRRQIF